MTVNKHNESIINWKEILLKDEDFLKPIIKKTLQEILEGEMVETVGVCKGERSDKRKGYRSGYYSRKLVTRVGQIDLRIPQDREGNFSTDLFDRYQRSEKALVAALVEMYIQGVSTRKIKTITEELCGHSFSAAAISQLTKKMDEELNNWAERKLDEEYPYLILDARYEKIREDGVVRNLAVLVALGINKSGRREVLATEIANKEAEISWKSFLVRLKERGLKGVKFIVSDNHEGLKKAITIEFSKALWQRCYVHFLRNAVALLPSKIGQDCINELKTIYNCGNINLAHEKLKEWILTWGDKCQNFCDWVEENIEETLTFYALPVEYHQQMRSTNMLERLNEEIKRRTRVVRIFPNTASCLRLVRAILIEIHEEWIEQPYLNINVFKKIKEEDNEKILMNKTA
jgi:putative transposase